MLQESNKRIAKNTAFLYIRMIVIMTVTLYTTRVVLKYLGVEDYGIYTVVGGVVVLLGFLQNALTTASQRFITYELGRKDDKMLKKTFSMSMTSHISIVFLIIIFAETVGLWFVNSKLNIAADRMVSVNWVYQFSVLTFIIKILRVPYEATVIAYEKMSFFAYVSSIEAGLRLAVVFLLPIIPFDKLSTYGILIFLVALFSTALYKIYCNKKFRISKYKFEWDKAFYWQMMSFSGWTMLGGIANVSARQGGNILLNIYNGVIVNAAFGIANQVGAAISTFAFNLLTAFNPQIIKYYAAGDHVNMQKLIFRASSYSYYLVLLIGVPFIINTEIILRLWLGNIPDYTIIFCKLVIAYQMIDMMQAPLTTLITATGKIKVYQIWLSALLILNLPVSWYLLKTGWSPYWLLIIRVMINVISAIVRIAYVKYFIKFPSWIYFKNIVLRAIIVTAFSFVAALYIKKIFATGISGLIYTSSFIVIVTSIIIYFIGISKNEQVFINKIFYNILVANKSKCI